MASNPYVNRVDYNGSTLIDITDTTAAASDVVSGKWFYLASGQKVQGSVSTRSSSSLSASGATVTAPAGYYASDATKTISSGTEGTPTATKGTVSNHQVSITPSVTNSAGYISGGTKTGSAVTVQASELVSGSQTKTSNGTYDVTDLASLVVAVPFSTIYTSTSNPSGGSNGDVWIKTVS